MFSDFKVRVPLADWFESFCQQVSGGKKITKRSKDAIKARFFKVVGELEYLGFLKNSLRTPGKVTKLEVADEEETEDTEEEELLAFEDSLDME